MGNVYVTGSSDSNGVDFITLKYNAGGTLQWKARYCGSGNGIDEPVALAANDSMNVYVSGSSQGLGTRMDYAVVKYNSADSQWVVRYDGTAAGDNAARAVVLRSSSELSVTGGSQGTGYDPDHPLHIGW